MPQPVRPAVQDVEPRADAARILSETMKGRHRSTDLINRRLAGYGPDRRRDAALMHELVMGVLRQRLALLAVVGRFVKRPLHDLEDPVREVVLCMAYQALFLDRIPPHARVSTAVEAARRVSGDGAAGFVNAVGRALEAARSSEDLLTGLPEGVRWSLPDWALKRIRPLLGADLGLEPLARLAAHAPVTYRVNRVHLSRQKALQELDRAGVRASPTRWANDGIVFGEDAGLSLQEFVPGRLFPQDEASQLVGQLLDPRAGERVLDLCAGVGGKTSQILALAPTASVTAVDLIPDKLTRCLELCRAQGLPIPLIRSEDGRRLPRDMHGTFHAVLLDAPCTGLGTLVRRPEVRYLRTDEDVARAAELQFELLSAAADLVRPTGRIIYAVCSFAREEGAAVVKRVLSRRHDLQMEPLMQGAPFVQPDGSLLTLPWRDGMDGFYVCRLRRIPR